MFATVAQKTTRFSLPLARDRSSQSPNAQFIVIDSSISATSTFSPQA